jgi:restriction system protein
MSRRRKSSPAEDFMELVAMLPWWAGVALAAVSYAVLHSIVSHQVIASVQPGQIGAGLPHTIGKTLASIGQYLVPLLCFLGAAVSAWRRRHRQALIVDVAQSKAADALDGMSWAKFEMLVGEAFRLQGYRVLETGGGGADGGIDLVLTKGNENLDKPTNFNRAESETDPLQPPLADDRTQRSMSTRQSLTP